MPRLAFLAFALGLLCSASSIKAEEHEHSKIGDVMSKYFKGKESFVAKANAGQADEATLKAFVEAVTSIVGEKPPLGDQEAWKKKMTAVVDAGKALQEKKEGAAAAFKAAVDCKSCHTDHRPKK